MNSTSAPQLRQNLFAESIDEGVLVTTYLMQVNAFEPDGGAFGEEGRMLT